MISEMILQNAGDKQIVFWGGWDSTDISGPILENGKSIVYVAVDLKAKGIPNGVQHISIINGKCKEYYIVAFPKETNEIRVMFQKYGYSTEDIFYINHMPVIAKYNGYDKYGNYVFGYAPGCKIYFEGYNASVKLENVQIGSSLKLVCGGLTTVEIRENVKFFEDFVILIRNLDTIEKSKLIIEKECAFHDGRIALFSGCINIGENCTFGGNIRMVCEYGMEIICGKDNMFSHDIFLQAGDGHSIFNVEDDECTNSLERLDYTKKGITLGDHVWVGLRSVILNGSKVGNGSIIGAMSLVKGTCPNNCMIAGNPAKIIKSNMAWSRNPIPIDGGLRDWEMPFYNISGIE